jgi:hypothetical protein
MVMAMIGTKSLETQLAKAVRHWSKDPVAAIRDWFQVALEPYQAEVITDLFVGNKNRVAMKSGHGVGKTSTLAFCAWYFLIMRPHCRVVATAPTSNQLMDVLWPEIGKWHNNLPDQLKFWDISATHIRHKKHEKTWFATARTSNKPENMQGFHNDNVLVLCEEASGIPANIFEVIEGILSNAETHNQEAKIILAGNPTQTAGEFFNAFHRNKDLYARYTVSGHSEKPTTDHKTYISGRVSQKYRDTIAAKYGLDSPVYDVRVTGLFPREADDVVIPLAWAEACSGIILPHFDKVADPITLVMDVARFGGDETVVGQFRKGHCIKMESWARTSTNQCSDILFERTKHRSDNLTVARIVVDEPGVGSGVVDTARRDGLAITPYHGGLTMKKDLDPDEDVRMFANRRSRDWWYVRRLMEKRERVIPADEELINQLASVKYDYVNEKIKVETKKEMRDRLGEFASPDRADVIIMGMAPFANLNNDFPVEMLDLVNDLHYGPERPTAQAELDLF